MGPVHIDYIYSFNNIKCLVHVKYCSGDVMVNDIDKIPAVMETSERTKLGKGKMQAGGGSLRWGG